MTPDDSATVRFDPDGVEATVEVGETVLDAALAAGIDIEHLCGGNGLCGTCRLRIDTGASALAQPTDADELLLDSDALDAGYRLSCRSAIEAPGEVTATVPSASRAEGSIVLTEGTAVDVDLDPAVRAYHVTVPVPSIEDNLADRERLLRALAVEYDLDIEAVDHAVQQALPHRLREHEIDGELHATAIVYEDRELIELRPGVATELYGLAVDIGTTTLAVYLLDLETGETLAVSSMLNPQREHGEDIMTRMRFVRRHDDGLAVLQGAIVEGVNQAVDEVTAAAGIDRASIYEAVFVGNTAMHHVFLGIDPDRVAGSPYIPANQAPLTVRADELDLEINPSGRLSWLPISGGWVGPDKLSVLLVSGHYRSDETVVCIDIGTNGEVSVSTGEDLWVTSAPAGPALEGGELTDGTRARPGAIDHVRFDPETGEPTVETIDGEAAIGLCGSGVIDALAGMFRCGVIDRRGQFTERATETGRVRSDEHGRKSFVLVNGANAGVDRDLVITQEDIRAVQMAKAAIQAATNVLLEELDVESVDRLVVAGGFGNYIDPDAARVVGLYPDIDPAAITSLGNGAGAGAQLALLDRSSRAEARDLIDRLEYYEIAGTETFRNNFLQAMYLPHQDLDRAPRVREEVAALRDLIEVEDPARFE